MKRVGKPISISLTDEQIEWLADMTPPGSTRSETIRRLVQEAMDQELKEALTSRLLRDNNG